MLRIYVDVQHNNDDEVRPFVMFAYNAATLKSTQMTSFELVLRKAANYRAEAVLPFEEDDDLNANVQGYLERTEEVCQLAHCRTIDLQLLDAGRYNLRCRDPEYTPGDCECIRTPIRRHELSGKLFSDSNSDPTVFHNMFANISST